MDEYITGRSNVVTYHNLLLPYFFCGSFVLFISFACHAFASVHCFLVVTCCERLLFVMSNCDFVTFQCGILGQVWYFIVLIPDHCHFSYFLNLGSIPEVAITYLTFEVNTTRLQSTVHHRMYPLFYF